jgi:hypothetical protein
VRIFLVFRTSFVGSSSSTSKSALYPARTCPTLDHPRISSKFDVAAANACLGLNPTFVSSNNSVCKDIPGIVPNAVVPLPVKYFAPALQYSLSILKRLSERVGGKLFALFSFVTSRLPVAGFAGRWMSFGSRNERDTDSWTHRKTCFFKASISLSTPLTNASTSFPPSAREASVGSPQTPVGEYVPLPFGSRVSGPPSG